MERPPLRQVLLLAAIAVGISTTVFAGSLTLLASPTHFVVYHLSGRPSALFVPAIADTLVLATACFAALFRARQGAIAHRALWSCLLCLYPWIFIRNLSAVLGLPFPHRASITVFASCGAIFLVLTLGRSRSVDLAFAKLQRFGKTVLAAVGVVGVFALLQLVSLAVKTRHLNNQVVVDTIRHPISVAPQRRVIWILLDELAFRQLYEHRLTGLQLPAFDQLRAESTVFSNVQPAGIRTEIVLPALITGDAVDHIQSTAEGALTIHDARGWHAFDQRNTVFADADAMGYRTAIVGWFNPYCRILSNVLDSCFWVNHSILDGASDRGMLPNLFYPVQLFAEKLPTFLGLHKGLAPVDVEGGKEHIRDFVELDRASDAALTDPRTNFLFLHMPVPHPSGIWDRQTGKFAVDHSCYVDNLALADDYLAHVRSLLEATGQWSRTTVVIMGDHAWRTQLIWKGSAGWNQDDQLASDGGQFDPRPAYLIKLPYQQTAATVRAAFPAIRTRALLDEILLGQITTPAQLEQWVTGASAAPSVLAQTKAGAPRNRPPHS